MSQTVEAGKEHHHILLVAPLDGHSHFYIRRAFQQLGHEVTEYDYRRVAVERGLKNMNEGLLDKHEALKPDLTLILKGELIFPPYLRRLHPSALWNFDFWYHVVNGSLYSRHARATDIFLTPCGGLVSEYRKMGINAHYLLEASDPELHHPVKLSEEERKYWGSDVSFVGTVSEIPDSYHDEGRPVSPSSTNQPLDRSEWLQAVGERFHTKIWGSYPTPAVARWHVGRRAEGDEGHNKVVSASKINLDRTRDPDIHGAMSARVFRIMAAKGFLLMRHIKGLEEQFQPEVHLATYTETEECLERIQYYLDDEEARTRIAQQGYEQVIKRHKWTDRIQELLKLAQL